MTDCAASPPAAIVEFAELADSCPPANPHSQPKRQLHGVEHFHWPARACLPGCAPSQLLHACSLAEYGRWEKVLDFSATIKNIIVINTVLVLNPKYSSH